jgi:hypothetical protein
VDLIAAARDGATIEDNDRFGLHFVIDFGEGDRAALAVALDDRMEQTAAAVRIIVLLARQSRDGPGNVA